MSKKTFGTILKIAGFAALAVVTFGVGSAIIAGVGAGLTLGAALAAVSLTTFGTAVLAGGLIAINIGGALSKGRPQISAQEIGGRLNIRQDPNAFRDVLIGTTATAGVLRYKNLIEGINDEPDTLWLVLVLAGYPCDGLDSFIFNGETITVNGDGSTDGTFAGKLFVYFRTGEETDHAFPALVDGVWDAKARRGRGLCCAAIKIINDEVFEGKVEPVFVVRGAKLFDARLDTAWGGSGAHDFADDTTFEYANNPSLAKLTFLRGFYIQDSGASDVLIAGRGLKDKETTRFDFANWIASANTDEDQIPVVGGGNIDRYTADGIIQVSRSPADTIKILDASQAGTTVFSGGKYRSYPGIYRSPTLTFGEADIIGVPKHMDIRKGQDGIINVVHGSFASAADRFELRDYPRQKDAASITRVGEMPQELNLPFTTDHRMAQRIALISMRQANAQRSFTALFSHRGLRLSPGGETVQIDYPHFDFVNEVMRLTAWALIPAEDAQGMPGLNVNMTFVQDLSSFYSWTAGTDEQSIVTPGQQPGARGPGGQTFNQFNEGKTYVKFDGTVNGSRLQVADDPAWDWEAAEAGTWEWEGYVDDDGVTYCFIDKGFTGVAVGWAFRIVSGVFRVHASDGVATQSFDHGTLVTPGHWHHFAVTRTAAGVMNSFLDVELGAGTITENDSMASAVGLHFGIRSFGTEELSGRMRNIRRWSDVRTVQELLDNRRKDLAGDEAGLIGLWRCDEASGTIVFQGADAAPADSDALFVTVGPSWGGEAGVSLADETAINSAIGLLDGAVVPSTSFIDEGNAIAREFSYGNESGSGGDGDAVTFEDAWVNIPDVEFTGGGTSTSTTLTAPYGPRTQAINLTVSGFTIDAVLVENVGGTTPVSDSPDAAGGGGDPDFVIHKSAATEAWDDKYTYQFDVQVQNLPVWDPELEEFFYLPGQVVIGIYTRTGAGSWIQRATKAIAGDTTGATNSRLNQTKQIIVDGLGLADAGGTEFGISIETVTYAGSNTILNFDQVDYSTASAPAEHDATNGGDDPVKYTIAGGVS